ncbi:MAG TPA: TonB-dependent receptor [Cellvibrio sp.]|nr:TonB-dependent receptor [Cellvibrio sp.]
MKPINNKNSKVSLFSAVHSRHSVPSYWKVSLCAACILFEARSSFAVGQDVSALYDLSLEELGNIQVTSVSKKEERLSQAAASIYVITNEAIRRAEARNIPEALRLAPTLQVAQISAYRYAISARGFNSNTANKLLVMIDGRTIYNPLFAGVLWESQDILLDDVDRIEVISGPGGTLWGANAVNGVINIITRQTEKTLDNLLRVTEGQQFESISIRHGGKLADSEGNYRVYGKFDQRDNSVRRDRSPEEDAWQRGQIGFRSDWNQGQNAFTLQGDAYQNSIDQSGPGQQENTGANILGRWNSALQDGSNLRIQTYIDHLQTKAPAIYSEKLNTLDIEIEHSLAKEDSEELIWGGGYRVAKDRIGNTSLVAFLPAERQLEWANIYIQQKNQLWKEWLFTLGGKLESNDYTGTEFLPKATLAWQRSQEELLWFRLSRTVRAPSRIDRDLYSPGNAPYIQVGGPEFRSEIAYTSEIGWRAQLGQSFNYSLVAHYSEYDHLRSLDQTSSGQLAVGNGTEAKTSGLEALANFQLTPDLSFDAGAVYFDKQMNIDFEPFLASDDGHFQWQLGTSWRLQENQHLQINLRHVSELPFPKVPAYTSLDMHFNWRLSQKIELSLAGRNLNDPYHEEFAMQSGVVSLNPIQIERELELSLRVHF